MEDELSDGKVVLKICYGRLSLPSSYKVRNGDALVLTRSALARSSLAIYTRKQWIPIRNLLLKNGHSKRGKWEWYMRYFIGHSEDCFVKSREIRISSHLIKVADLHSEVIWIQRSNRVEICNPMAFDEWKQNLDEARK